MIWARRTAAIHHHTSHVAEDDWSPLFITGDADSKTGISISFDLTKGLSSPIQAANLACRKGEGISLWFYALTVELRGQVTAPRCHPKALLGLNHFSRLCPELSGHPPPSWSLACSLTPWTEASLAPHRHAALRLVARSRAMQEDEGELCM